MEIMEDGQKKQHDAKSLMIEKWMDKMHSPSFSIFWTVVSTMAKEARPKSTKHLSGSKYNPYK
jgi:hypothetical protein